MFFLDNVLNSVVNINHKGQTFYDKNIRSNSINNHVSAYEDKRWIHAFPKSINAK